VPRGALAYAEVRAAVCAGCDEAYGYHRRRTTPHVTLSAEFEMSYTRAI